MELPHVKARWGPHLMAAISILPKKLFENREDHVVKVKQITIYWKENKDKNFLSDRKGELDKDGGSTVLFKRNTKSKSRGKTSKNDHQLSKLCHSLCISPIDNSQNNPLASQNERSQKHHLAML